MRRQRQPDRPLAPVMAAFRHPLEAVPMPAPGVAAHAGTDGGLLLLRSLDTGPGLRARLARRLRLERSARLSLDRQGACFWSQVDGVRNLADIAAILAREFALGDAQARAATVMFVRDLMVRHFLVLWVAPTSAAPGAGEAAKAEATP